MDTLEREFLTAVELHSPDKIRALLNAGLDPRAPVKGKPPVVCLTEMYSRSDKFADCLRLLLEHGAVLPDPKLREVLLNDAAALRQTIQADPSLLQHRTSLVSAFTPLLGAPLLHVAAEYGHLAAASVLIEMGADLEARAAVDDCGLNGHTALFHTVNSIGNHGEPILRLLLDAGAKTDVRLPGITWGKTFPWETTFFDVTPVSYAQLGLLPQVHRQETDIYANMKLLLKASNRKIPPLENVPNRYLQPKGR